MLLDLPTRLRSMLLLLLLLLYIPLRLLDPINCFWLSKDEAGVVDVEAFASFPPD
jgi:hypothetical protein